MESQPKFVKFKEPRNLIQGIDSAAYLAWRAGTKTLFDIPARQAK